MDILNGSIATLDLSGTSHSIACYRGVIQRRCWMFPGDLDDTSNKNCLPVFMGERVTRHAERGPPLPLSVNSYWFFFSRTITINCQGDNMMGHFLSEVQPGKKLMIIKRRVSDISFYMFDKERGLDTVS